MNFPDLAIKRALDILNGALERDPMALTQLLNARISSNERLTKHKFVQTGVCGGDHRVGVLGLDQWDLGL